MRSSSAVALFTLAIITECFGAQSDRSRSRSGPVRSVPVAADIKRDVDFDCPEEFGYYPHPTDCTLYYVCVFGGALLESCTGGLMYSHELQTCDWPRNVGCDGTSAVGGEELERINERDPPPPPPPPPRRTPPPPPPRAQPNPVVTSRGQPKFNRQEYEKQQQLYAEVDDLPPVEEIESDRQQRVYRGQPPTIGQVQKDRDGYAAQPINTGRNLNSNIIPASIPQNSGKIGSFSFGSQVDERRAATATPAPQSYSLEPTESVAPVSYSASPRPKMLYNGSQNYSPDQYDPFYAVYDEDGELYKDTDYVQQYNTASLRPAVQQTYRGTPPPAPARRPVETYTPRPSPVDYDDELIQPQINNQNQYQAPIRHSTRGEGNELGYDHNPSSVRTTLYEATTLSTTPPTTSTSTTTQRPTTAPYTEAMTPSRYTPRSSTDESPIPESSSKPSDETSSSAPTTSAPIINFSSLAKPFEKTDNVFRLKETISTTETHPTSSRRSSEVTNNSNNVEVVRSKSSRNNKKVSLTSGFSIRRNPNNANNPYTLTVLTRPLEDFDNARKPSSQEANSSRQRLPDRYYEDSSSDSRDVSAEPIVDSDDSKYVSSSESSMRRNDYGPDNSEDEYDIPVYIRPTSRTKVVKSRIRTTTTPLETTTKYNIKSINIRPTPFVARNQDIVDSTENSINTEALIETGLQNAQAIELSTVPLNNTVNEQPPTKEYDRSQHTWNEPTVSPFKTLDNLRNSYRTSDTPDPSTSTTSTTVATTTTRRHIRNRNNKKSQKHARKPSYYSYRLEDEVVPDQTTEIFNGKVKTVIKAFLNNFVSSTEIPQIVEDFSTTTSTTTVKPTVPMQRNEDEVVNIGFQKRPLKYVDEKPLRSNVKRLQIITEAPMHRYITPSAQSISFTEQEREMKDFSSTTTTMATMSSTPFTYANIQTSPMPIQSSTSNFKNTPNRDSYQSKFSSFITSKPENEPSFKFQNIINDVPSTQSSIQDSELDDEVIKPTQSLVEDKATTETEVRHNNVESEIASTTSTTKSTTTLKFEPTTSTTKSISFPPRASRVNPAIKLAATNPGGGRRSYQSSSKCSSDNSLQANPKCNEIKYQRYKLAGQ